MKYHCLFSIIMVVLYTTFAKNIQRIKKRNGVSLESKSAETSDECQYINNLIDEDKSYNCCEYEGIGCIDGHITKIYIYGMNFRGRISESIENLTYLKALYLVDNHYSGPIPESIGKLTNLEYLDLVSNNLNGTIPESIGNLTNLKKLRLSLNKLIGSIPESIGKLTNLKSIDLSENELSGPIPESIGKLTNLESLDLSFNKLSGPIPESLTNIRSFSFSYNCIDCDEADRISEWECDVDSLKENKCSNRCGIINGKDYGMCPDGKCCSKKGYCGTNNANFCSPSLGCQANYGICIETRCGPGIGSCADGQCCSKKGYCGTTSAYCSTSRGCQSKYGKCNTSNKKVVTATKKKIVTVTITKKVKKN